MAFHWVSTMEKPMDHLSMTDWQARVGRMRNVANVRRADGLLLKNSSRMLRNESRIEGNWANYESKEALTDRIAELEHWRDIITNTFKRIELEIEALHEERKAAEDEMHNQGYQVSIIGQVLSIRDSRLTSELTHDEPDNEIKYEVFILENNQRLLADRLQNVWEKLRRLEEVRFKISTEIQNKVDTANLDGKLLVLERSSTEISYKTDPLRNPKSCCSYEHWLEHSKNMKQLAENELSDTSNIREALFVCREKAHQMMQAQQERSEYVLRKRIFQTQQMVNELQWQQLKTKEELHNAMCEIQSLEEDYRDKVNVLELAETRLETRAQRCVSELCLDHAHNMLCLEVEKLREIRRCLLNKMDEYKTNFNLLSDHAKKIDEDLDLKQHSLNTDKRAMELRKRLNDGGYEKVKVHNPSEQTDRNIKLAEMEKAVEKY